MEALIGHTRKFSVQFRPKHKRVFDVRIEILRIKYKDSPMFSGMRWAGLLTEEQSRPPRFAVCVSLHVFSMQIFKWVNRRMKCINTIVCVPSSLCMGGQLLHIHALHQSRHTTAGMSPQQAISILKFLSQLDLFYLKIFFIRKISFLARRKISINFFFSFSPGKIHPHMSFKASTYESFKS